MVLLQPAEYCKDTLALQLFILMQMGGSLAGSKRGRGTRGNATEGILCEA